MTVSKKLEKLKRKMETLQEKYCENCQEWSCDDCWAEEEDEIN